jgi:hypothetical protein
MGAYLSISCFSSSDILARRKRRGFPSTAGNPVVRFGFKTGSPGVDGAGFDPRPGASCGAVTGAPIRKRVIAVDFQPTALTQSVEPRGSVSARFTPCRPKAINRASRAPQTWVECGPHPALVRNGMWRNPIETHVCGRLSGFGGGSGRATGGGCVTERTRFTPAVNGGILSLIKDSPRHSWVDRSGVPWRNNVRIIELRGSSCRVDSGYACVSTRVHRIEE